MAQFSFWRGTLVRLRAVEEHDIAALRERDEDPDSAIDRAEDMIRLPVSREQAANGLEQLGREHDEGFFWMVETLDHQHVGFINTFECDQRVGCFKYAVLIKRPFWGRGYAREALTLVLRYYFRELRYQKVTALVYSFNQRSFGRPPALRVCAGGPAAAHGLHQRPALRPCVLRTDPRGVRPDRPAARPARPAGGATLKEHPCTSPSARRTWRSAPRWSS